MCFDKKVESLFDFDKDLAYEVIGKVKKDNLPIILWGAGGTMSFVLKNLMEEGIQVAAICDNDSKKCGSKYGDIKIVSFLEVKKMYKDCIFFITVCNKKYVAEIKEQITKDGQYNRIYHVELFYPFDDIVKNNIKKSLLKIEKAYNLLEDDLSRETFYNKLKYLVSKDSNYLKGIYRDNGYFQEQIFNLTRDEVFVDCGSYHGEDTIKLINLVGNIKKAYCFEPDKENFKCLEDKMGKYKNTEIFNNAVWDKRETLYFLEAGTMGSNINNLGNVKVEAVNLDGMFKERKEISFIKMDVEGAELEALNGAKNIIQLIKPKLAICVYHTVEHHWEIPIYIKELNPSYKIFMRHHNLMGIETVCYAVNSEE